MLFTHQNDISNIYLLLAGTSVILYLVWSKYNLHFQFTMMNTMTFKEIFASSIEVCKVITINFFLYCSIYKQCCKFRPLLWLVLSLTLTQHTLPQQDTEGKAECMEPRFSFIVFLGLGICGLNTGYSLSNICEVVLFLFQYMVDRIHHNNALQVGLNKQRLDRMIISDQR